MNDWYEQVAITQGWLMEPEARLLYRLASNLPPGSVIVEIGSYHGKSTLALCFGAQVSSSTVYAIDPHEHYIDEMADTVQFNRIDNQSFLKNMAKAGVGDILKVINLSSDDLLPAWRTPIDLLWIDGRHNQRSINADTKNYGAYVKPDGYMLLHDSNWGHVKKRVSELAGAGWIEQERAGTVSVLRFR